MMSEFRGHFWVPSLPHVRILFTDPLLLKTEFHGQRSLFLNSEIINGCPLTPNHNF